jgi:hypothetical protein
VAHSAKRTASRFANEENQAGCLELPRWPVASFASYCLFTVANEPTSDAVRKNWKNGEKGKSENPGSLLVFFVFWRLLTTCWYFFCCCPRHRSGRRRRQNGFSLLYLRFNTGGQKFSLSEAYSNLELFQRVTNYGVLEGRIAYSRLQEPQGWQ